MATYMITGVSKGLGESLAKQLLKPENRLICISRRQNQELLSKAEAAGVTHNFYACDLNETDAIHETLSQIHRDLTFEEEDQLILINNAGVVEPIVRIGEAREADLAQNIKVNLIAPMILSNWFIQSFSSLGIEKTIVNISSGAASNPYDGWASYCSSKAGLDMFTRTVALEQDRTPSPVKMISFSPGIMDTEMQGQIRSSDEAHFSNVEQFRAFKENGHLRSPDLVATKLLELLDNGIESGRIYSIHELI